MKNFHQWTCIKWLTASKMFMQCTICWCHHKRATICLQGFHSYVFYLKKLANSQEIFQSYQCTNCGKSFRHLYEMILHQITHTVVRPYQCKTCGKMVQSIVSPKSASNNTCWSYTLPMHNLCETIWIIFYLRLHQRNHAGAAASKPQLNFFFWSTWLNISPNFLE